MKKVINYIKRCGGELTGQSSKSYYFKLCNKIIRVSDHIGLNSNGVYSIICKNNKYFIWCRVNGSIDVYSYEDVKSFIRMYSILPVQILKDDSSKELSPIEIVSPYFTENQMKQIKEYLKTNKNKGLF